MHKIDNLHTPALFPTTRPPPIPSLGSPATVAHPFAPNALAPAASGGRGGRTAAPLPAATTETGFDIGAVQRRQSMVSPVLGHRQAPVVQAARGARRSSKQHPYLAACVNTPAENLMTSNGRVKVPLSMKGVSPYTPPRLSALARDILIQRDTATEHTGSRMVDSHEKSACRC